MQKKRFDSALKDLFGKTQITLTRIKQIFHLKASICINSRSTPASFTIKEVEDGDDEWKVLVYKFLLAQLAVH